MAGAYSSVAIGYHATVCCRVDNKSIAIGHAMSLYGDLHVELEMSILDRSYGVLKRSIKMSIFCRVTVNLYVGVDH
jgi:hypothetical protein